MTPDRVVLLGFSQGACLAQEFAARHAQRYAGIAGLSGGLIGPPGTPRVYPAGSPVRRCSSAAAISTRTFRSSGCASRPRSFGGWVPAVDERIYPRMGHTVNRDELEAVDALLLKGGV